MGVCVPSPTSQARRRSAWDAVSPSRARAALIVIAALAFVGGFLPGTEAASQAASLADPDLTRLLRAMAAIKALLAAGAISAVVWRLGVPVALRWFVAYALACSAMSAGPGLIWGIAHVGIGALLLHGGLLACVVLLWRDPAVEWRLEALVSSRRERRAALWRG